MQLVFSTYDVTPSMRYDAWREALCGHYVNVDTVCDSTDDYDGFIKEANFGVMTVSDCYLSPQIIARRASHIARIDKDCCYLVWTQKGIQVVEQHGRSIACGEGSATLFSASEPYILKNDAAYRAIYLEFPRASFAQRCDRPGKTLTASLNMSYGMGRIIASICSSMVLEAESLQEKARSQLGEQVLDMLAIALDGPAQDVTMDVPAIRSARLRQIRNYIDSNIGNPLLNPERVAKANQMSVRALHYVFKDTGKSVSDYIWGRRLERCRSELEMSAANKRTITEIAFASGFNSMSHFSSLFRSTYGITPSDVRSSAVA